MLVSFQPGVVNHLPCFPLPSLFIEIGEASFRNDHMNRELQLAAMILPAIVVGTWLVYKAIADRPPAFRLSDYFLAGGKIGPGLTRANVIGGNIALANGLWYFVLLGYIDGVLGITAQLTWGIALFLMRFLVPIILKAARCGETLHGFLGTSFGSPKLRVGCAFVTSTGYLLNFGFETYVSGTIMASVLGGDNRLRWIFVFALVGANALYIAISGFIGNISQDRRQNHIGVLTMVGLLVAVILGLFGSDSASASGATVAPLLVGVSWTKYLGIIAYTLTFPMVDISNWQSIAANKNLDDSANLPPLKRSWTESALFVLIFPGAIGVALGCLLRWKPNIPDTQLIGELTSFVLPGSNELLRAIVLGLLLMGFLVLALCYAENLLSAAQFTIMADVFGRKRYDQLVSPTAKADLTAEDEFVRGCQRATFAIAVVAFGLFALALWRFGEANVFGFMFIIFGSAISMFPALLMAVLASRAGRRCDDRASRTSAWLSIVAGYSVALSPLAIPALTELSPVFSILASTVVLFLTKGACHVLISLGWMRPGGAH
jgi:hypothetical protein